MRNGTRQRKHATRWTTTTAAIALAVICAYGTPAFAQTAAAPGTQNAQPTAPQSNSPMVKPPEAASGSTGKSNPDNMPIKRPDQPTHDSMMHAPPASGANAK
jgi:hypothetical protein